MSHRLHRRCGDSGTRVRYDRSLAWASRGIAVEVLVELTPALPQPYAFLADRGPADHVAPGHPRELDDGVRIRLQVQPPGRLGGTQPFMAIETRLAPSS